MSITCQRATVKNYCKTKKEVSKMQIVFFFLRSPSQDVQFVTKNLDLVIYTTLIFLEVLDKNEFKTGVRSIKLLFINYATLYY